MKLPPRLCGPVLLSWLRQDESGKHVSTKLRKEYTDVISTKFHRLRRKKAEPLIIPTITDTSLPSLHQQQTESLSNALDIHPNAIAVGNLSSDAIVTDQAKGDKFEGKRREWSIERHVDPLGLNVIYAPEDGAPAVDIILVHGLGGTSQKTWSRNKDPQFFWPKEWLPSEPGFAQARILSFGYNAHFASSGRENILSITDFAKDLLFGMKYGLDQNSQELEIGNVCERPALCLAS